MDALELQRRLWARVRAAEGKIGRDTRAFVRSFIESLRREGYEIGPEAEKALSDYFSKIDSAIRFGVRSAIFGVASDMVHSSMKSAFIERLYEEAFSRRWPDGLTLSDRLWWWQDETRRGVTKILAQGVRLGQSASSLVYKIQYEIERGASPFATVISDDIPAWTQELLDAARAVIKNPKMRKEWEMTVLKVMSRVEELSKEGSYSASKRLLEEIQKAVQKGSQELVEEAISWWHYNRQLYAIKRVVRTEMATAHHRAVIAATKDDGDIIGYQWRLSPSHPRPDICDYYAGVDFGLGKGVWPKDKIPSSKAHPQCMCILVPRVTKVKEKGSSGLDEFLQRIPEAKKKEILPVWAQRLEQAGVPLDRLIKSDGSDFLRKRDVVERIGKERFQALEKAGHALGNRQWTRFDEHVKKRLSEGHIRNARELDKRFERALSHKDTEIYAIIGRDGKVGRVYGLNGSLNEVTVINKDGKRVTWFPLTDKTEDDFLEEMHKKVSKQVFKRMGKLKDIWGKN